MGCCCEADGVSVHCVFNHEIPVQNYSKTPPGPNECHDPALITHNYDNKILIKHTAFLSQNKKAESRSLLK